MQRLPLLLFFFCFSVLQARGDTVLVLPFFNHSKSANLDWIGESICETVREALASQGVLALDREDRLEAFRRLSLRPNAVLTRASVIKVGEALDAAILIYGQYELAPSAPSGGAEPASRGTLRITARILDLRPIKQGPEFAEFGPLEDLAALEARLAWQALQFVIPNHAPSQQEFLNAHPHIRLDAVESYVRGLLAPSPEQKHRFFTQAARLDERYSQPCFQLGKIYWAGKDYRIAAGWLERVTPADSHYMEAQYFLGLSRYYTGDIAGAEKCFALVAGSVPLNEVYNNLGAAQLRRGAPAALENFRKALEGDSADPDYHFNLGYALWKSGRFEEAADSFRASLDRNAEDTEAVSLLGRALKKDGPRPGDPRSEGRERLKTSYEEAAYRQLQAELRSNK